MTVLIMGLGLNTTAATLMSSDEVCLGQRATYNCTTMNNVLVWQYSNVQIGTSLTFPNNFEVTESFTIMQVLFTITNFASSTNLMSRLTFNATLETDGQSISCFDGMNDESEIQVATDVSVPTFSDVSIDVMEVTLSTINVNIVANIFFARGIPSFEVVPLPLSPPSSPVISSTISSTSVTVFYNTEYTITITATNCAGTNSTSVKLLKGKCSLPSRATGVIFLYFNETIVGESISYMCGKGYRPKTKKEAICTRIESNLTKIPSLTWLPNPAAHECIPVSCSTPPSPRNGFIEGNAGLTYTEGDNVKFQCFSGLIPDVVISTTCMVDGTWNPDPLQYTCIAGREIDFMITTISISVVSPITTVIIVILVVMCCRWKKCIKCLDSSNCQICIKCKRGSNSEVKSDVNDLPL